MKVEVECYSGYRGEETPRALAVGGRRVRLEVLDRWAEPERRCFRVRGDDGAVRVLAVDEDGEWSLMALVKPEPRR